MANARRAIELEPLLAALPIPALLFARDRCLVAGNRAGLDRLREPGAGSLRSLGLVSLDALLHRVLEGDESRVLEEDPGSPLTEPVSLCATRLGGLRAEPRQALVTVLPGWPSQAAGCEERDRRDLLSFLIGGIAHEIRSPLTTISGMAQVLALNDTPSADQREGLALVQAQVERADGLLRNLVGFSRGAREPAGFPVSVNEAIRRALELLAHDVRAASLELDESLGSDLPLVGAEPEELLHLVLSPLARLVRLKPPTRGKGTLSIRSRRPSEDAVELIFGLDAEPPPAAADTLADELGAARALAERLGGHLDTCPEPGVSRVRIELPRWSEKTRPTAHPLAGRVVIADPDLDRALGARRALPEERQAVTLATSLEVVHAVLSRGGVAATWIDSALAPGIDARLVPRASLLVPRPGHESIAATLAAQLGIEWATPSTAPARLRALAGRGAGSEPRNLPVPSAPRRARERSR